MKNIYLLLLFYLISFGFVTAQNTFYTLASGDWENPEIWTLDPAGVIYVNPDGRYPGEDGVKDDVVIQTGKVITVPVADVAAGETQVVLSLGTVKIEGSLKLLTTTGHSFDVLRGSGKLFLQADNFPTVTDASHFITAGKGEGAVVLEGDSFSFGSSVDELYDVEVDMNSGQTVTLIDDLALNGNLTVTQGTLQINDDSNTTPLTLTVSKNVTVESLGAMTVGSAGAFHWFVVSGDFKNYGTVTFSNSAQYSEATSGAVKLKFTGTSDNNLVCENTTNLYRLFLDKGVDRTFLLNVSATDVSYFKLYGPVSGTTSDGADGSAGWERLPIVLKHGTLKLGSNISLSSMGENRDGDAPNEFTIPVGAGLWIDGANVTTSANADGSAGHGITLYGLLRISGGTLTVPSESLGITYETDATNRASILKVEGGDVYLTQLIPGSSATRFNYLQSGGTLHFDQTISSYVGNPNFQISGTEMGFEMTSGKITFSDANFYWDGDFYLDVPDGNYNVRGGTLEIATMSSTFNILSTVPLYDLSLIVGSGSSSVKIRDKYGYYGLKILNDFSVAGGVPFDASAKTLEVSGDITFSGTLSNPGELIFKGNKDAVFTNNSGGALTLGRVVVYKDIDYNTDSLYNVTLSGTDNFSLTGSLVLKRGNLDVVDKNIQVADSVIIKDGSLASSGSGGIELNGSVQQFIKGALGQEQDFGRLILNNSSTDTIQIALLSDVNAKSVTFSTDQQVVYLGSYNLTIEEADYASITNWGVDKMFMTAGLVGDGGLTLPVTLNSTYSDELIQMFPVGTYYDETYSYRFCEVYADGTLSDTGSLRMVPVEGYHPTTEDTDVADHYYRIFQDGLDNVSGSDLTYKFIFDGDWSGWRYVGVVLYNYEWDEYDVTKEYPSGSTTIKFDYDDPIPLNGDYTIGWRRAFRRIDVYYSITSGDWDDGETWTLDTTTNDPAYAIPTSADIAVIRGTGTTNDTVKIVSDGAVASQVIILGKSDTGIGVGDDSVNPPTLFVKSGTSGHEINLIKGNGKLVYENTETSWSDFPLIDGDHTELCNSSEAVIEYTGSGTATHNIPTTSNIPYYPNMYITGTATDVRWDASADLLVKENLVVDSAGFLLDGNYSETVTVLGDVIIGTGTLSYKAKGIRYMEVYGDIEFTDSGTFQTGSDGDENMLYLKGGINQGDGSIDLYTGGYLTVCFTGDSSVTYTSNGNVADFYRLKIDKPEGYKVDFNSDFNLNIDPSGTDKSIELISGECHLNSSGIDIDLSTGGNDFKIPEGTKLTVDNGATVNVGGGSNTGIWLDGSLIIDNNGVVNCNQGTSGNADNYIAYTSSGSATIWLGDGAELNVGSQIRRSLYSDVGILNFTQSTSACKVTVGENEEGDVSRGMFEIMGTSSFTQADNAKITIARGHGKDYNALYFEPETYSSGTGSGFVFGDGSTPQNDTIAVYAGEPLMNIEIDSVSYGPVVSLRIKPLVVEENIVTDENTEFDANGLDVTINGSMHCQGNYVSDYNTTYFESDNTDTISGNVTFYNLVKQTGVGDLLITDSITVENKLELLAGAVSLGGNTLTVLGDVTNDVAVTSTSGQGVLLNGTYTQEIGGAGSYSVLSINNGKGVVLPTQSGSLDISSRLRMNNGVFDIGRNLLVLEEGAYIDDISSFSETNMVQTNLSFTDNGIKKYFPEITVDTTFTYPIGSLGKYTPVVMNISGNDNATGSIRVKAANEPHITVPPEQQDSVLQYYWTLDAEGIAGFKADTYMYFYQDDAIPATDTADYYTAKLLLGTTEWAKFTTDDFNGGTNNYLYFNIGGSDGTDDPGIDGDYTAGCAIPDDVATYITVADGDWNVATNWAVYDPVTGNVGTAGENVPSNGPSGSIIYVDNALTVPSNGYSAYRTIINESGSINTGTTFANRLGDVSGTGTLMLSSGDLPAGVYDEFFSEDGGTLEFGGTSLDYDVLSEITQLNNLKFSGTGTRNLPNLDVQLLGDLIIDGPDVVNLYDRDLSVKGNIDFAGGTFDSGEGTLLLNGSSLQTIDGIVDFTTGGGGELYNLEVNSTSTIDIKNNIEVSNLLVLTEGVLNTSAGGTLTITNSLVDAVTGGKSTAYVEGPLRKFVNDGESFLFPVGDALRYGEIQVDVDASSGGYWEAEYFNHSPADDGYDPTSVTGDVAYVSHNEYWTVKAPADGYAANLTMRWDANSGVNPNDDFRVVRWTDLTTDAWGEVTTGTVTGDATGGTTDFASDLTFGFSSADQKHYLTFGTITIPAYTWTGGASTDWFDTSNWSEGILPSASDSVTVSTDGVTYYPVIDSSSVVQVNTLTIISGATLTLDPGAVMTVTGDVITNDGLTINNTVDHPASFIVLGSVTGNVTVKWTYPADQYWYIGHPVEGITYSDFDTPTGGSFYLFKYTGTAWEQITATDYDFDANPVEGYAFKNTTGSDVTISYTGVLHNLSYSCAINGWNLIANPYASYIDVEDIGFDYDNSLSTIWTTTDRQGATQYAAYDIDTDLGVLGGTRYVAPGQAIWLRNYSDGTFSIATSTQVHAPETLTQEESQLKGALVYEPDDVLRLTFDNGNVYDEVVMAFRSYGTTEEINSYDSGKRFGSTSIPNVYTQKGNSKIAIGIYPEVMDYDTISLGYTYGVSGELTIKATNINDFAALQNVYLLDKVNGVEVNLRETPEYTFTAVSGGESDRFVLYFNQVSTGINNNSGEPESVRIYGTGSEAVVDVTEEVLAGASGNGLIKVYNASGNLLKEVKLNELKTTIDLPDGKGIFIIELRAGKVLKVEKVPVLN
ncbi:MAG: hypothetical protein GXO47_13240 [Chlorobi bacterium]|nr:hypothetical protein [Chlorobiota bacterium]